MFKPVLKAVLLASGPIAKESRVNARLILCVLFASIFGLASLSALAELITDSEGRTLYLVELDGQAVRNELAAGEAPARTPRDELNRIDRFGWQDPRVRALARNICVQYECSPVTMSSYVLYSFSAFLRPDQVGAIQSDPRVAAMLPGATSPGQYSAPPWFDYSFSGETVSYGKIAIGTNDLLGASGNAI